MEDVNKKSHKKKEQTIKAVEKQPEVVEDITEEKIDNPYIDPITVIPYTKTEENREIFEQETDISPKIVVIPENVGEYVIAPEIPQPIFSPVSFTAAHSARRNIVPAKGGISNTGMINRRGVYPIKLNK